MPIPWITGDTILNMYGIRIRRKRQQAVLRVHSVFPESNLDYKEPPAILSSSTVLIPQKQFITTIGKL